MMILTLVNLSILAELKQKVGLRKLRFFRNKNDFAKIGFFQKQKAIDKIKGELIKKYFQKKGRDVSR